jgi:hypothetical protein
MNSQLIGTATSVTGNITNTTAMRIGGRFNLDTTNAIHGSFDDVRVYNRAISAGEVSDIFNVSYLGSGNGNSLVTTGAVGIGMIPTYPLDVTGAIRASGDIVCGGSISAGNLGMINGIQVVHLLLLIME